MASDNSTLEINKLEGGNGLADRCRGSARPAPTGGAGKVRWNERRERFVAAIAEGKNQTEAAIAAGYSPVTAKCQGYKLMQNPAIAAEVERRRNAARIRNAIDVDTEIAAFQRLEEIAIDQEQMVAAVKAREAISKICGIWPDNKGVTIQTDGNVIVSHDEAITAALNKRHDHVSRLRDITPAT